MPSKPKRSLLPPGKELAQRFSHFARDHRLEDVFRDWCEMCALAISNSVDRTQFAAREERYLAIAARYTKEQVHEMCAMLGLLTIELERTRECVMSRLILDLGLAKNQRLAQHFTPHALTALIAGMIMDEAELKAKIEADGYITLSEPACGAGGMVIAFAGNMHDWGINYQQHLHVTAVDVDPWCVHMTYLQVSLLGIPAVVIQGNSLSLDVKAVWYTPFHILNGWQAPQGDIRRLIMGASCKPRTVTTVLQTLIASSRLTEAETGTLAAMTELIVDGEPAPAPEATPADLPYWRIVEHPDGDNPPFLSGAAE